MKKSFALLLFLVPAICASSRASISLSLQVGDAVTILGQANGEFEGYGGAFNWQLASVVSSTASSPVGTAFQSFCDEAQQGLSAGQTYKISDIVTPTLGQAINSSGQVLNDFKGIYLFEEWSDGLMAKTTANAAAVQIAAWQSEGYNLAGNNYRLINALGYSQAQYTAAETAIQYWLGQSLTDGEKYSALWRPTNVDSIELVSGTTGMQDQLVIDPPIVKSSGDPPPALAPEPAGILIWAIGASLFGVIGVWRGKRR